MRTLRAVRRSVGIVLVLAAIASTNACAKAGDRAASSNAPAASYKLLSVGDSAPAYNVVTFAGDSVHIGKLNEPITVLNVWATWCTSCREEMADLEALHREFAPNGVRVLGVSVDVIGAERVKRFVNEEKVTFGIAYDPDGVIQQRYQVVGIPATFIVAKNGRLLWKSAGNVHGVVDSLRHVLIAALK